MAAKDTLQAAQANRYVQRLVEDENLRSNLIAAYAAARSAYGRVGNGTSPAQALFEDAKLQDELKNAANALREATGSLREPPKAMKKRRRGRRGRSLLALTVGAALAIGLSSGLRSKVLDTLFGAEEEFDYSASTAPSTPAPAGVSG
jgi:hypothetical protein